jgi:hypothetical protein
MGFKMSKGALRSLFVEIFFIVFRIMAHVTTSRLHKLNCFIDFPTRFLALDDVLGDMPHILKRRPANDHPIIETN